ncbi:MAG: hypothetical protein P8K80_04685 [Phycisphaerales bacterium]|nr:hypothetical protein [Phycisphaerales bacterium]
MHRSSNTSIVKSMMNMALLPVLLLATSGDAATIAESESDASANQQIGQLGTSLKAAVLSGSMTEKDARAIWASANEVRELQGEMESLLKSEPKETGDDAKSQTLRLIPPDPREPRLLLQPEFLERDSIVIIEAMDLDPQRAEIVGLVFRDYVGSYDIISQSLLDALQRYQRAEVGRDLASAVERLDRQLSEQDIDMAAAMSTMQDRLQEYARQAVAKRGAESEERDEKARALAREWVQELSGGLNSLDENMNRLRDRMVVAMEDMEEAGDEVTPEDLHHLAIRLRQQRDSIRDDVIEALRMTIVEDGDDARLERLQEAIGRLRFTSGLRMARLGGERINPRAAMSNMVEPGEPIQMELDKMDGVLGALAMNRLELAIDRELAGIQFMVDARQAIGEFGDEELVPEERWGTVIAPYAQAWHDQIDASVACRDFNLLAVDELTLKLMEHDLEAAFAYRDLALQPGFPDEMRRRWYERALAATLRLEELSEEIMISIGFLQEQATTRARQIRDRAIEGRMERDIELARAPVLRLWGLGKGKEQIFEESDWKGREFKAHEQLADQVEDSLRVLLTPEQFDALPVRTWRVNEQKRSTKNRKRKSGKG